MAQLSLFFDNPLQQQAPFKQRRTDDFYPDVFICSCWDEKKKRIRIKPLANQAVSDELFVCCPHKARKLFPEGTIFKLDLRLAYGKKGNKYLRARAGNRMQRAIEYFDYNLQLQKAANEHKQSVR